MSFVKSGNETELYNVNNKAVTISVIRSKKDEAKEHTSLQELGRLANTLGLKVMENFIQVKRDLSPSTYAGKGFIESVIAEMEMLDAAYLIFDDELSPSQAKTIGKMSKDIKVIDRTEVILQIFKQHAKTKEARLQVKLAELKYAMPRLKNLWAHFGGENVAAGRGGGATGSGAGAATSSSGGATSGGQGGVSGGGMASRGMGEKQIEVDQRLMRNEIHKIEMELKKIEKYRETQGKRRSLVNKICLVGYTNAGKSTLFNRLTDAGVYVQDQLFATLESTSRKFNTGIGKDQVLIDTVGFISKLPHDLVASFKATLRDVNTANLLLHTIDASDPEIRRNIDSVQKVLKQIDADEVKQLIVLNKCDNLSFEEFEKLKETLADLEGEKIFISALKDLNIKELITEIDKALNEKIIVQFKIPYLEEAVKSKLYDLGKISEVEYEEDGCFLKGEFHPEDIKDFQYLVIEKSKVGKVLIKNE